MLKINFLLFFISIIINTILFVPLVLATEKVRLAIMDTKTTGFQQKVENIVLDLIVTEADNLNLYNVISKNEINALLSSEQRKLWIGCKEQSCFAEIGMAMGAEKIVNCNIAKFDNIILITMQLINTKFGYVENRIKMKWEGNLTFLSDLIIASTQMLLLPLNERI